MSWPYKKITAVAAIILLCIFSYGSGLNGPMIFDDRANIESARAPTDVTSIGAWIDTSLQNTSGMPEATGIQPEFRIE